MVYIYEYPLKYTLSWNIIRNNESHYLKLNKIIFCEDTSILSLFLTNNIRQSINSKTDRLQSDSTLFQSLILFWVSVRDILNIVIEAITILEPIGFSYSEETRQMEEVIYFHNWK